MPVGSGAVKPRRVRVAARIPSVARGRLAIIDAVPALPRAASLSITMISASRQVPPSIALVIAFFGLLCAPLGAIAPTPEETEKFRRGLLIQDSVRDAFDELISKPGGKAAGLDVAGSSLNTPTAFGGRWGFAYTALTIQSRDRYTNTADGAGSAGLSIGNPEKWVGLDITLTIVDLAGVDAFQDGSLSFRLHRHLGWGFAVAAGYENGISWGERDGGKSFFGVVSKKISLTEKSAWRPEVTMSLGAGNGRFRPEKTVIETNPGVTYGHIGNNAGLGVFGSFGVTPVRFMSLITEWTGQDLYFGTSFVPLSVPGMGIGLSAGVADITGTAGDGARVVFGIAFLWDFLRESI